MTIETVLSATLIIIFILLLWVIIFYSGVMYGKILILVLKNEAPIVFGILATCCFIGFLILGGELVKDLVDALALLVGTK